MSSNVVKMPNTPATERVEAGFQIEPLSDVIIIEQLEDAQSKGGILLVGKERKYTSGRVVAVGPGRVYSDYMDASGQRQFGQVIPTSVKVGDYVIFGKYQSGGEPIEVNGKVYIMAREGDLGGRSIDGSEVKVKLAEPKDGY
jgi:co-chaperonin GroES (HSP10)